MIGFGSKFDFLIGNSGDKDKTRGFFLYVQNTRDKIIDLVGYKRHEQKINKRSTQYIYTLLYFISLKTNSPQIVTVCFKAILLQIQSRTIFKGQPDHRTFFKAQSQFTDLSRLSISNYDLNQKKKNNN